MADGPLPACRPAGGNNLGLRLGSRPPFNGGPQVRQEPRAVRPVLAAGVVHGVEAGNRAADAAHFVVQENPDRRGPLPHDVVDELGGFDRHDRLQCRALVLPQG